MQLSSPAGSGPATGNADKAATHQAAALPSATPTAARAGPPLSQPLPFTASPLSRLAPFSLPAASSAPWHQLTIQNTQPPATAAPVPSPGQASLQSSVLRRDSPTQTAVQQPGVIVPDVQPAASPASLPRQQGAKTSHPFSQSTREKVAALQKHLQRLQQTASDAAASPPEREQAENAAAALLASLQTAKVNWAARLASAPEPNPASAAPSVQEAAPTLSNQAFLEKNAALATSARTTAQPAAPHLAQKANSSPPAVNRPSSQAGLKPTEHVAEAQVNAERSTAERPAENSDKSTSGRPATAQASTIYFLM